MEFAVYRVFRSEDGRRMGTFTNMFPAREEAEAHVRGLPGEHEVVGLWTRELGSDDDYSTVVFSGDGVVAPAPPETGTEETER